MWCFVTALGYCTTRLQVSFHKRKGYYNASSSSLLHLNVTSVGPFVIDRLLRNTNAWLLNAVADFWLISSTVYTSKTPKNPKRLMTVKNGSKTRPKFNLTFFFVGFYNSYASKSYAYKIVNNCSDLSYFRLYAKCVQSIILACCRIFGCSLLGHA